MKRVLQPVVAMIAVLLASMPFSAQAAGYVLVDVSLVPEPETWAMLIVGVGLVGLRVRQKLSNSAKHIQID